MNPHAREAEESEAYSVEEVIQMLTRFPEPSRTAFGVAALTGLRRGEVKGLNVEGLNWEDYHDGQLFVNRTISRIAKLRELPPKTKKSRAPVPVVPALHELLEEHHRDCPNPKAGPIFASILRDGHWTPHRNDRTGRSPSSGDFDQCQLMLPMT